MLDSSGIASIGRVSLREGPAFSSTKNVPSQLHQEFALSRAIQETTIMASTTPQSSLSFPRETFAKLSPHPYLLAHLQPNSTASKPTRANGRSPKQFRQPHVNNGSLTHAEGSAVVRIGDTTVVCGIRGEILLASNVAGFRVDKSSAAPSARPGYNEAKEMDLLVPNIELATGCSPAFLPGQPPSTLAQSLSTRIYSLLHSSGLVNGEDLRIWYQPPDLSNQDKIDEDETEKIEPEVKAFWTLYIDILFISLDGNPFDAAWAAVISALRDVRLPKAYWDPDREMVLCEDTLSESKKLQLNGLPIAVTMLVFKAKEQEQGRDKKHWILVDPDTFEEGLCDESVTIVVDCGSRKTKILGLSKAGGTIVGRDEMKELVGLAEERWSQLSQLLNR
jgi:exosome complex component RRP43